MRRTRDRTQAVLPAALLITAVLAGCGDDGGKDAASTAPTAGQSSPITAEPVDLASLLRNPGTYDERRVTVTGTARTLAPNVLALSPSAGGSGTGSPAPSGAAGGTGTASTSGGPGTGAGAATSRTGATATGTAGARLVVVFRGGAAPQDGADVTATGTVQDSFEPDDLREKLGVTLDENTVRALGLDTAPAVLLSDAVEPAVGGAPGTGRPSGTEAATGGPTGSGPTGSGPVGTVRSP